jgi:excisionase family DNA binding protein
MSRPSSVPDLAALLADPTCEVPSTSLLKVGEVAQLLRTSRKAVYSMVERGQLPGIQRIGRRVLVRRSELVRWLDHNCTPSQGDQR